MKAPDKIYIKEFPEGLNQMWSGIVATKTSAIAQHEYIRKDALLEWAQDYLDQKIYDGKRDAMKELIEKIERL